MKLLRRGLALVACLGVAVAVALCAVLAPTTSAQAAEMLKVTMNFYDSDGELVYAYIYEYENNYSFFNKYDDLRPTFGDALDALYAEHPEYENVRYWQSSGTTDLSLLWSTSTEGSDTIDLKDDTSIDLSRTRTTKIGTAASMSATDRTYNLYPYDPDEAEVATYEVVDVDDGTVYGKLTAVVGSNFMNVLNLAIDSGSLVIEKPGYEVERYAWGDYPDNTISNLTYCLSSQDTVLVYFTKKEGVSVVTFDYGVDGLENTVVEVTNGQTVERPVDPTRDGYTFDGWYTDEACTVAYDFSTPVTEDITLYAKWTKDAEPVVETHTVTFWDGLESTEDLVVEVEDGQTVERPADPTCEGWTFVGWFSDTALTQEWDFSTPVTEDITLYAKWVENTEDGDGSGTGTEEEPTTPSTGASDATTDDETEETIPETGDATMAVAGVSALGCALASLGVLIKRRR